MEDHIFAKGRHPSSLPRVASRTSTSSSNTRMTSQSNSSGSLHVTPSPQQLDLPHAYRHHHASCRTEQVRSQFPAEASQDRRLLQPTLSSFLREKLQRERKAESERTSSRLSTDLAGAAMDIRAVQSSPVNGPSVSRRPRSSDEEGSPNKKGLGLNEMEQTLSRLHKHNFDLKFELSHRRERQTILEKQVEELEGEKMRAEELEKDKAELLLEKQDLLLELKTRDKAIEEAVAMIVALEARVDQLSQIVGRIEPGDHAYPDPRTRFSAPDVSTPKTRVVDVPNPEQTRVVTKMPSFLFDQVENTENLRNVYLGSHGSLLSLPRTLEDSQDADRSDLNGIKSPSLSVLSESSFMSVYGRKGPLECSSPPDDLPAFDGSSASRRIHEKNWASQLNMTPTKQLRQPASRTSNKSMPFQNGNNTLEPAESPLQRLEKLEASLSLCTTDAPEPLRGEREDVPGQATRVQTRPRTKQEKRDALQKVFTNEPFQHAEVLPPTPDTISTSTLRHFQNATDVQGLMNEHSSYLGFTETSSVSQISLGSGQGNAREHLQPHHGLQAPLTAMLDDGRRQLPEPFGYLHHPFQTSHVRRPRSADETTISRHRGGNNWDSDSSEDEFVDGTGSAASSFDYWMRESQQPSRSDALDPMSSVSQAGMERGNGRTSPDLFSFPSNAAGWAPEAMFSSSRGSSSFGRGGNGHVIPPVASAHVLDALGDSLPTPLFRSGPASPLLGGANTGVAPPPPNRRSSLAATTGSVAEVIGSGTTGLSPNRPAPSGGKLRNLIHGNRARSNSIDVRLPHPSQMETKVGQNRSSTVPPKQLYAPPARTSQETSNQQQQVSQKSRHYPPTASQAPRSRTLSLFRRSIGSAEASQVVPPSSAPATETSFRSTASGSVGVPSWGRRNDFPDDERASVTPPPILRNKEPSWISTEDGGAPLEIPGGEGAPVGIIPESQNQNQEPPSTSSSGGGGSYNSGGAPLGSGPATPTASATAARPEAGGGKRKWLGLGRMGSLRNRVP